MKNLKSSSQVCDNHRVSAFDVSADRIRSSQQFKVFGKQKVTWNPWRPYKTPCLLMALHHYMPSKYGHALVWDKHMKGWAIHDDVIKWKHFPRYWPFVRGIHRSPVTSPHKGQWRGALMFSLICTRVNGWVNNGEAGDLRRYSTHYDVTVMSWNGALNPMEGLHMLKYIPL